MFFHKSIIIFLTILTIILSGLLLYKSPSSQPEITITKNTQVSTSSTETNKITNGPKITIDTTPVSAQTLSSQTETSLTVANEYLTARVRVLGIFTTSSAPYYLIVGNDRKESVGNEDLCGSMYSPHTCYFFIEPKYWYGAPTTTYLGSLTRIGRLDNESVTFISDSIIEFDAADGDAGMGFHSRWQIDTTKHTFTRLRSEVAEYQEQ